MSNLLNDYNAHTGKRGIAKYFKREHVGIQSGAGSGAKFLGSAETWRMVGAMDGTRFDWSPAGCKVSTNKTVIERQGSGNQDEGILPVYDLRGGLNFMEGKFRAPR